MTAEAVNDGAGLSSALMWMQAGDVVILHPELMHMSAANVSSSIRLSCDTRWQPASVPRDLRFRYWHTAQGEVQTADGGDVGRSPP